MKYKTEWDLTLLYKSEKDPQIEKDIRSLELRCTRFEKKYKGKDFIETSEKLTSALKEYSTIEDPTTAKPWWYFALRSEQNSDDAVAGARSTQMQERIARASNKITFFLLELAKIPLTRQKLFLKDSNLKPYRYMLERVFSQAQYNLSENEEQLASLLSQTSYVMWVDGQRRVMGQKTISLKGEEIPLSKAKEILSDLPKKERYELFAAIGKVYEENSMFAESEINAICNYKKVMDERRGYKKPYSATILGNENDEETIEELVTIVKRYFRVSKRFYSLHAKLLNEKKITRADREVRIGKIDSKFTFDESVEIVKNAFSRVDGKYAAIVQSFVDNGQIDLYPRKGKQGGAFCWPMGTLPTYVLLNHSGDIRSVETLAHEMGHAIHSEFDKELPLQYRGHSTATAEVASTFFEQLVADQLSDKLSQDEQIILLHGRLLNDVLCVFGQIAGFIYETELHEKIRAEGQVNRGAIAALLRKHYDSYLGDAVLTTPNDGYYFVGWWHTRMFFYVYTYAYGQLISRALYEKWKADNSYAKKIEQFLSAGRSMSPKDIFASIGINTNAAFFEAGLKGIERDIDKLEKLSKNWLKAKKVLQSK